MDFKTMSVEDMALYIKARKAAYFERTLEAETGLRYYRGEHDIDKKKRLAMTKDGTMVEVLSLPNAKITDNQYAKAVDQKTNYQFSLVPSVAGKNEKYVFMVQQLFDKRFMRTLNKTAEEAFNCGIGWALVMLNETGDEVKLRKLDATEIVPDWEDNNHEKLRAVIRTYAQEEFVQGKLKSVSYCELYTADELIRFKIGNGEKYELVERRPYIEKGGKGLKWDRIPIVYFKANKREIPLIRKVKAIQDAINTIISNYQDNMLEDARSTVLVVKNYGGTDTEDIRGAMNRTGIIAVESVDGVNGGVDTLRIEVNSENYKTLLQILKDRLIENARAIDIKQERGGSAPNEMNIKSMYSDIELDANGIELEFQASFEYFLTFFKQVHRIDQSEEVDVTFKRNIMVNESETVRMIKDSVGLISDETLIANHPLVENAQEEIERIKKQNSEDEADDYHDHFHGKKEVKGEEEQGVLGGAPENSRRSPKP